MLNDLGGLKNLFFGWYTNLGAGSPQFKSGRPDHLPFPFSMISNATAFLFYRRFTPTIADDFD
jgi:hypothetical protein